MAIRGFTWDPRPVTNHTKRSPQSLKFLVVDDHAGFRQTVRDFLPSEATEVLECANGLEAVEAYARQQPDWVIMDAVMPIMDGVQATRRILERFPAAQIVVLTQFASPEMRAEALEAGASAFLAKDHLASLTRILTGAPGTSHPPGPRG